MKKNKLNITKKTVRQIIKHVNILLDVDITIKRRLRSIVEPRQIIQAFLYYKSNLSLEEIASFFSKSDSTVLHSAKIYSDLKPLFFKKYPLLFEYLDELELKINKKLR